MREPPQDGDNALRDAVEVRGSKKRSELAAEDESDDDLPMDIDEPVLKKRKV